MQTAYEATWCFNQLVSEGNPGREPAVAGVDHVDGGTVVRLAGELDLYNAGDVREALLASCEEHPRRLVVDLAEVSFLDSTVLGVLVEARSRVTDKSTFMLAAPGTEARRALELSGLDRHFLVLDTVELALGS
jgi:anti-sigma B factor antagonist